MADHQVDVFLFEPRSDAYLPRPRIEISGPQGVQATFDWQAARDSVVGRMCTATLVNDVETY